MDNSSPSHGRASSRGIQLGGIVTALVTPLRDRSRLDEAALGGLIERQVAAGVQGLFVLGSVGEGPSLEDGTYERTSRCAVEMVARRSLVLGGASDNSVERCLRRLEVLARVGVDVGVLTLPYYGWPASVRDSIAFFRAVAARSPLPIVPYDLPKAVGWRMPLELIEALYQTPNVIGLKCTHQDEAAMIEACRSPVRPAGFAFLPGNSGLAARMFAAGADGLVCTPSNIYPELYEALFQAHRDGRTEVVTRLCERAIPAANRLLEFLPTGAASIKAVLEVKGLAARDTVWPWPQATDEDLGRIAAVVREVDTEVSAALLIPGTAIS